MTDPAALAPASAALDRNAGTVRELLTPPAQAREVERWVDFAARLRYKEGWSFRVQSDGLDESRAAVQVTTPEMDSSRAHPASPPGVTVKIGWSHSLDWYDGFLDDRGRAQHVRLVIDQIEAHERDEWFRLDDRLVDDPHLRPPFVRR